MPNKLHAILWLLEFRIFHHEQIVVRAFRLGVSTASLRLLEFRVSNTPMAQTLADIQNKVVVCRAAARPA